jgi:diacylglycerol kinase family enzyme
MANNARPSAARRIAAVGAIALAALVVLVAVARSLADPLRLLFELLLFATLVSAAWVALTRTATARVVATTASLLALALLLGGLARKEGSLVGTLLLAIVVLAVAAALGHYALGTTMRALRVADLSGPSAKPAKRGVLFMNLKSGGGKPERFGLVAECRRRGIEPVVLEPGEDWPDRVREIASSGADVIGMAGGDGSQAMVASVAAELGLAMVVVPAGTRNHLALDLGLDRDDVVGALDAYGDAVERHLDLADLNGRVFVNNVSLGLYATIVRSPEYRDAKVDTTLATLPRVLGKGTEPFDLRFTEPDGSTHEGAHLIQISNNPYGTTTSGIGSRPRLDTRQLQIISLVLTPRNNGPAFLAMLATGHPERFEGFVAWTAADFEVTSGGPIDVGLDGEAMQLDPPLRFSIRPAQVRVRLPHHAIGFSPAARSLSWRDAIGELWGVVRGRPSRFEV